MKFEIIFFRIMGCEIVLIVSLDFCIRNMFGFVVFLVIVILFCLLEFLNVFEYESDFVVK